MSDTQTLPASLGADGKVWCLPCSWTKEVVGGRAFGWRDHPVYGDRRFHTGVDLTNSYNTPLYATKDGKITLAQYSASAGNWMILDHEDGTKSVYMHMGQPSGESPNKNQTEEANNYVWRVRVGDEVKQGQHIGDMGSTGTSTGSHLHFGVQKDGVWDTNSKNYVDPMQYIGGARCTIVPGVNSILSNEHRIHPTEIPLSNEWEPDSGKLSYSSNKAFSGEGSPKMNLIRRHSLMGNSFHTLFSSTSMDKEISDGYGVFGLNSEIKSDINTDKEKVMNIYRTVNADGTTTYKTGALKGEDLKVVAAYIYNYLTSKGWSHNSVIAVLANIKAESGLNPARWESDINWSLVDANRDGYRDDSGSKCNRGFGLIQWTPWWKFYDKVDDPFDIDAQIEGIITYQSESYFVHKSSTYNDNIRGSNNYKNNAQFKAYFDENEKFPITKQEFREGKITTNVTLSEETKISILTVAYCYNGERPASVNADTRINYASDFIEIFGEGKNNSLFTPDITKDEYWDFAKDECGYKSGGKIIKNNFSYTLSRADEVRKLFASTSDPFKINKGITNWFEYNNTNLHYDTGQLPRTGAIMCWKHNTSSAKNKVLFVESTLGTHWVSVSEYNTSDDKLSTYILKNDNHNWAEDSTYSFQGFIYLLPDLNIDPYVEDAPDKRSSITYDEDGNLVLQVYNKSEEADKYYSISFSLKNVKHTNTVTVVYEGFVDNEKINNVDNRFAITLSQQVWNCPSIGTVADLNTDEFQNFCDNWPTTYFPYKPEYNEKGEVVIPTGDQAYKNPYKYQGPFPIGNLCLLNEEINNKENEAVERTISFDLFSYRNGSNTIDSFNSSGNIQRFIRNYPGYLNLIVKAPKVDKANEGKSTMTTIKIKEIIIGG